ncbi:Growth-regulating factor 3 [Raphanus sativus]|uniref:Growth-regulating factor n=1 Tax=Raphanus sativus TaxID=3726 RepID=A0A6J0JYZ2_RAPSA|nr:growth-regulating factor 3 [Raphanus sativus]KAJ4891754.1 Growth-regulating factor 3 [Raphanus sativus]
MDLQLKQWRSQQQQQTESEDQPSAAKIPKHVFDQIQSHTATSTALPLFSSEPTSSKLSSLSHDSSSRFPKIGSFFSWAQWQELELQALIYRYMMAGAAIPQELLLPIKKSLLHLPPSYFLHHPLHHLPHYQPAWYMGKGAMDPEPGRCRRTDGKKWRCSRDVFPGHKYCERHMHRGRNRSRKPVETPTVNATTTTTTTSIAPASAPAAKASLFAFGGGGEEVGQGESSCFFFSGSSSSSSSQLLNLSQSSELKQGSNNHKRPYESHNGFGNNSSDGGHTLRHFFDDWPRSEADSSSSPMNSTTCLSISMPVNSSSDVSLKLSTGNEEEEARSNNNRRDQQNMSWWSGGGSLPNHHNMGGPLAEALRSSSSSSPTSVLHQLWRTV